MKRILLVALFALGFALAGGAAAVIADTGTTPTTGTSTTSTSTTATTTTTTTTTATTTTAPRPPQTLPASVRVGGVPVGGLTPASAAAAVQTRFAAPLAVVVDRSRLQIQPTAFARAYVSGAIARARVVAPGTNVALVVVVRGSAVRAWTAKVAKRFARTPVDASLSLRTGRPRIAPDRPGRALDTAILTRKVTRALTADTRATIRVRTKPVVATVARTSFRHVIVVNRALNRLSLYAGTRLQHTFGVATGRSIYPTPSGRFEIVVMSRNPWWYPPVQDSWAKGLKPVPPGPGNPLGTRWMGLSASGVGIHGTPDDSSIGYSASHGCIRMHIPDAEWLFEHVTVGTTVFIV